MRWMLPSWATRFGGVSRCRHGPSTESGVRRLEMLVFKGPNRRHGTANRPRKRSSGLLSEIHLFPSPRLLTPRLMFCHMGMSGLQ